MAKKIRIIPEIDESKLRQQLNNIGRRRERIKVDLDTANINTANRHMQQFNGTVANSNTIFGKLKSTISNTFSAGRIAMTSYLLVLNEINKAGRNAKETIQEIDAAITDLSIATNQSRESTSALVKEYNNMAIDLKSTTTEITSAADDYLRAGKTMDEAKALIEKSVMLSKLGQLDSGEATEDLLAVMNGFEMSIDEVGKALDSMVAIDMKASVSAGEIATALKYCSSSADSAGISFDTLASAISVSREKTMQSAETIGTFMNTVLSRFRDVKIGNYISEDGEDISDYESVLKSVGIQLRDSEGQFRDFETVLGEMASKWDSLSSVQQAALAKVASGTRQQNRFYALMQGYKKVLELTEVAAGSAGTAVEKFNNSYKGSIEAQKNTLQASFESMIMNSDFDEVYSGIIQATTALVDFLNETYALKSVFSGLAVGAGIKAFIAIKGAIGETYIALNKFQHAMKITSKASISTKEFDRLLLLSNGLSTSQMKLVLSTNALSLSQKKELLIASGLSEQEAILRLQTWKMTAANTGLTASVTTLGNSLRGLWTLIKNNPLLWIVSIVTIATSAWSKYKASIEETRKTAVQLTNDYKDQSQSLEENIAKYKELKEQLDNSNLSTDEARSIKEQLLEIQNSLMESYGAEASNLDLVNGKYAEQLGLLGELSKEKANSYVAENYSAFQDAKKALEKERRYDLGALFSYNTRDGMTEAQEQLYEFAKSYSDLFTIKSVQDASTPSNTDFTPKIILRADVETAEETIRQFQKDFEDYVKINGDVDIDVDAVRSGISDALTSITADEELVDYKTIYDEYMKAEVLRNDTLRGLYSESIQAVEDYNKALASGEGIEEAKASLDSVKESVQGTTGILEGSQDVFDEIFNQQITVDTDTAIENVNNAVDTIQQEVTEHPVEVTVEVDSTSLTNIESQINSLTKSQSLLNSALSEQYDNGTITSETLASLQEHYTDLEKAVEITTVGISINTSKLAELDKAKKKQIETDLISNEKALADQYNENSLLLASYTERLRSDTSLTEEQRTQLENLIEARKSDQLAIEGQIADLQYLQAEYNNTTSTFNTFMNALNTADAGNSYDSVVSSISTIKEQFEKGLIGTDQFRSFVDYMTYADMSTASVDELVSAYDEALLKAEQFYTEGAEGSINLLHALEKSQYAVHDVATDSWTINIDDMNKAAQDTGISVEALETQLQKLKDYGFDIDFSTTNDSFVDVNANLEAIRKRISEVKNALSDAKRVEKYGVDTSSLQTDLQAELEELEGSEASIVASIEPVMNKQKAQEEILALQRQIEANPVNSQMVVEIRKKQQQIADENGLDLQSIITVNSDTSKAEADAEGLKKSVDSMTMKPKIDITSEVANARSQIVNLVNGTYTAKIGLEVQGTSIITKVKNVIETAVGKTSESGKSKWTGSAFANGSWRVGHSGKALVGELGTELLVRDGKYQTIGENGAEFIDTKPSDIIFNHVQTSEILKNGHIDSRGRALMSGSAYVTGKGSNISSSGSGKTPSGSSKNKSNNNSSNKKNNSSDNKKAKTTIDWIKRKLEVLQKKIDETKAKFENLFTLDEKKNNLNKQIKQTTNLLKANEKAAKKYKKYADNYAKKSGLSKSLQKKVQSGDYNIKDYDSETAEKINKYKEYWDNYKEAKQQVEELTTSIRELKEEKYQLYVDDAEGKINKANSQKEIAKGYLEQNKYLDEQKAYLKQSYDYQIKIAELTNDTTKVAELQAEYQKELWDLEKEKFDNIQKYYENQLSLIELSEQKIQEQIDLLDAKGMTINAKYYKAEIGYQEGIRAEYQKSRDELKKQLTVMEDAGLKGTDQWYESVTALNEVDSAISECNVTIAEMNNSITEVANTIQEKLLSRLSDVTDEMDWIVGLMSSHDMFDSESGAFTEEGLATLGFYVSGLNTSNYSANISKGLVEEMKKALDNNSLEFTYNGQEWIYNSKEQLEEAIIDANTTWREQITESVDYSNKIIEMMIQKYQSELSVLREIIDSRQKILQQEKSLRDYQMSVKEKSSNIVSLRAQLAAISGDSSEEGMMRKQKLSKQLSDAEDDLENTEYDRYIQEQEAILDSLYSEYERLINKETSNRDALLQKGIDAVNLSATKIQDTVNEYAKEYNYSDVLNNIDAGLMSMTGESGALSQIRNSVLSAIEPAGTIPTAIDGLKLSVETGLNNIATLIQQLLGSSSTTVTSDSSSTTNEGTGLQTLDTSTLTLPTLQTSEHQVTELVEVVSGDSNKKSTSSDDGKIKVGEKVKFNSGKYTASSDGSGNSGKQNLGKDVYIQKINSGSKRPYLIGTSKSGGVLGWVAKKQLAGFSKGGLVEVEDLNRQIRANNDEALVSVQDGEGFLTKSQTDMFQKFVDSGLDNLVASANMLQPLVAMPKLPDVQPFNHSATQIVQIDNLSLPSITNYEEFKGKMFKDMQHEPKFEKMVQSMTLPSLHGQRSRLTKHSIKF